MLEKTLLDWAAGRGYQIAWGPASVLEDIVSQFDALSGSGELEPVFGGKMMGWVFTPEGFQLPDRKSVIVFAVPRPTHSVSFEHAGGRIDAILPPTYVRFRRTRIEMHERLREEVFGADDGLEVLWAPLKTVASRLGLIRYGRNNISYAEGLGSYHQLVGFITNVELGSSAGFRAHEAVQLQECKTCDLCIKACPTRAITEDRFLIHAERCLTYHNESKDPFPGDLRPSVHHCWIGCMRCQRACPLNEGRYRLETSNVSFDREETDAFLALRKDPSDPVWRSVMNKLDLLGLTEEDVVLSRNLRALIGNRPARPGR